MALMLYWSRRTLFTFVLSDLLNACVGRHARMTSVWSWGYYYRMLDSNLLCF
jgi:hypothetical protein